MYQFLVTCLLKSHKSEEYKHCNNFITLNSSFMRLLCSRDLGVIELALICVVYNVLPFMQIHLSMQDDFEEISVIPSVLVVYVDKNDQMYSV